MSLHTEHLDINLKPLNNLCPPPLNPSYMVICPLNTKSKRIIFASHAPSSCIYTTLVGGRGEPIQHQSAHADAQRRRGAWRRKLFVPAQLGDEETEGIGLSLEGINAWLKDARLIVFFSKQKQKQKHVQPRLPTIRICV